MFHIVLRKMQSSKVLFSCLIFGAILVTALVCSIPLYSTGAVERLLGKSLEAYQKTSGHYPGEVIISYPGYLAKEVQNQLNDLNDIEVNEASNIINKINLPIVGQRKEIYTMNADVYSLTKDEKRNCYLRVTDQLWGIEGIEEQIDLVAGKLPSSSVQNNCLEIMVSEKGFCNRNLVLDQEFAIISHGDWFGKEEIAVPYLSGKVVGVYKPKDNGDGFWKMGDTQIENRFIVSYDTLKNDILKEHDNWSGGIIWNICFDYHQITIDRLQELQSIISKGKSTLSSRVDSSKVIAKFGELATQCSSKQEQLQFTIWILISPILLMLIFYIFMIAQLIVTDDQNEIAGLKSRGATKSQILVIYCWEILIVCGMAFIVGPFVGVLFCKFIGSSSGFLEFVGRKALKIYLNSATYCYALIAQVIFAITMLIPVLIYSKINIVEHKQKKKKKKSPLWQRRGLDIILLAGCSYWYYQYSKIVDGMNRENVDPILFIISTLFAMGLGLFFLRVYPLLIKLIYRIGRSKWSPVAYATFTNVGRIKGSEQFIMLFMMMAIAIGITNANEARTINQNRENSICMSMGSDAVVEPIWRDINKFISVKDATGQEVGIVRPDYWQEPNLYPYECTKEIDKITEVVTKQASRVIVNMVTVKTDATLLAIKPNEFGEVTWTSDDLFPTHINNYLNILQEQPNAVFVSSNLKKYGDYKVGDVIRLELLDSKQRSMGLFNGRISGFINYWPSMSLTIPKEKSMIQQLSENTNNDDVENVMVICNFRYLRNTIGIFPYNIWIKKAPGVTDSELANALIEAGVSYNKISFADTQINEGRNQPYNMGLNGILTLGFIMIMLITTIGFIIYWILSIKERALQFGILRAMGLKQRQLFNISQVLKLGED